jgi:UDP-MurNAc hydroxylase
MKITHISNSFIIVESPDAKIVCDPWVGFANHGGWHSYPEYEINDLIKAVGNCTHVYISHLHSDHFDEDFLKRANLLEKLFIFKKFPSPAMQNRLKKIGIQNSIELNPFTKTLISDATSISIIPQMTFSNSEIADSIRYDLDTSIVIDSAGTTFFNQVDNPLSLSDFENVGKYISEEFGRVDIGCFACGAASEYPQCFIGIDRQEAKNSIVKSSLKKLECAVDIIRPAYAFLAGGSYFIPGKLSDLNKYIAQPTFLEAKSALGGRTNLLDIQGNKTVNIDSGQKLVLEPTISPRLNSVSDSINLHKFDLYPYQTLVCPLLEEVREVFEKAKANFIIKAHALDSDLLEGTLINFVLYDDMRCDENLIIKSEALSSLRLSLGDDCSRSIIVHMDLKAFYGSLTGKCIWNQVISGSLCLFERVPDIHIPGVLFSLNYLVARS